MKRLRWSVCVLTWSSLAWAMGPLQVNPPKVQEGLDAYKQERYEDALRAFEEAERSMPNSAALEFDRGNALYKLNRLDAAEKAYRRVQELDRGELSEKDYYNLGNVLAKMGKRDEAISAYRHALRLSPTDEAARHNLEVVLKNLPPPSPPQPDGGTDGGTDGGQDGGQRGQDAGTDGGHPDGGRPDGGGADGGHGDGGAPQGRGDGGSDGGQDGGRGEKGRSQPGDGGVDGGEQPPQLEDGGTAQEVDWGDAGFEPQTLNPKDAQRLLDALKQNEKNLQLWRFQQKKKPKNPHEKDW